MPAPPSQHPRLPSSSCCMKQQCMHATMYPTMHTCRLCNIAASQSCRPHGFVVSKAATLRHGGAVRRPGRPIRQYHA
eukprot:355515-Chlamydomonas_euryale.AAC.22